MLALVLPLTVGAGASWQKLRTLLAKHYEDIEVISLATPKNYDVAFSADTAMADCLVIARKKSAYIPKSVAIPTRFVSLRQRPDKLAAAGETARELIDKETERKLEDGPFGGDDIDCGGEKMGEAITANIPKTEPHWNAIRIQDFELVQTAYQLTQGKLWLPRKRKVEELKITPLKNVGKLRPHHRVLVGPADAPPFYKTKSTPKPNDLDGYPALWTHECKNEHCLLIDRFNCKLKATEGQEARANELWHKIAGRCLLTAAFTLGSQSLAVAITKEPCIGGTTWPNVNFHKTNPQRKDWDYAFSIWGNSTLGLLCYWWHASRQQPGRSWITISALETLPVLDFRALSPAQIKHAKEIFDRYKVRRFMPAYVAHMDPVREALDHAVLCEWLGFESGVWKAVRQLAFKWCAEPSVHGGKQRSQNAPLAV